MAPAAEGEFGADITMGSWRTALKKVGFADMVEVAAGGDMTAAYEAMEWAEAYKEGKEDDHLLLSGFCEPDQKTLSHSDR